MQETTNYKLKKIELTDSPADITVLNENWDKLDTEVKEHDSSLTSHAQSITEINEELESINTELDTKYDKAGGTINGAVSIASGGLDVTGGSTFNDNVTVKGMTVHEDTIRSSETNFLQTKVNVSRGTAPGSTLYSHWSVFDKDGYNVTQNRLAHIDYSINNTGTSKLGLYVNKYVADDKEVPVGLFAMWTGETPQVMLTHTPPANSNDKSIATTDWVRALRATASEYGLIKLADESDLLSEADEAALTVSGAYKLADFRRMSTAYALGDTVNCAFKSEYFLECTKAGTTSGGNLDTRNVTFGQVITDGTCRWTVRRHLKSVNGQAPDEDGNISVDVDTDNLAKLNVENTFTRAQNFLLLNPALRLKNSGFTRGTTPDTSKYWTYGFLDKNGEITGRLLGYINPDGAVSLEMGVCENTPEGPDTFHNMGVVVEADGTIYGYSPTPANDATDNEIVTAKWIRDNIKDLAPKPDLSNYAKLNVANTFSIGQKIESGNTHSCYGINYVVYNIDDVKKGSIPASNHYRGICLSEVEANIGNVYSLSKVELAINSTGKNLAQLMAYKPEAGSSVFSRLYISYPIDGIPQAFGPTPADDASDNEVVTAEWVKKSQYKSTSTKTVTKGNSTGQITLTNPRPFSIVNVSLHYSQYAGEANYVLTPVNANETEALFGCVKSVAYTQSNDTPGSDRTYKILLSPFIGDTVVFNWSYNGRGVYATIKLTYEVV